MTLIEVLAGLVIAGSLLAAMLIARGEMVSQWKQGQQRLEAVQIADRLLTTWWLEGIEHVPINESGQVDAEASWGWRTTAHELNEDQASGIKARQLRLEVYPLGRADDPAVLHVDMLIPAESPDDAI